MDKNEIKRNKNTLLYIVFELILLLNYIKYSAKREIRNLDGILFRYSKKLKK